MSKIKVKICGIKRKEDVKLCMNLGADILGFVTEYPVSVPWNLSRSEASQLLSLVRLPYRSCIVTGGSPEKVIGLAAELLPDMIQLHYGETLEEVAAISAALGELGIAVIKTVPTAEVDIMAQFGAADLGTAVRMICQTGVYGLLADTRTPANAAESSAELDAGFCRQIIELSSKPVFIAGGIRPDNVRDILLQTGAGFIDVMTGVETSPGVKDPTALSRLLTAVRADQDPSASAYAIV